MTIGTDLYEYSEKEIRDWTVKKKLVPGRVKGTKTGIQFVTEGGSERVEETDWETFVSLMKEKKLAVYGTKEGWMRIMRKK